MIKQGAEPVFIAGNQTGILFLHGFTASPHELRSFAELIHQKKGFTVSVPLIAGHGESNEILNNTRFNAFQNSADTGYQNLKKICNKIFLVGMSMGGSLCLDLASKYQVDGIILMGTPLFLPLKTAFLPIVLPVKKYLKKHDGPDIKDKESAAHVVGNDSIPLRALKEFKNMLKIIRRNLHLITAPALIMHSKFDHTINYRNAPLIFSKIGSQDKRIISYNNSYHILSLDYDRNSVFSEICDFITTHLSQGQG